MKTKFLALVLASTVVFSANAAVEGSWSTGIAGGWQHAFDSDFGLGVDSRGFTYKSEVSDKNGFDIKLDGEYNFTDWFGLGVSYDYLKGVKINDGFKKSNVHTDVASVYGRFALPIDANGSDVFFKVGPTYNWVNGYSDAKDKVGAVFGIGGQWAVNKSLAIRAGYDYLLNTVRSENRPDKINSGLLYLGLQYNFGAAPAPAPVAAPAPKTKTVIRVTENHSLAAGLLFPFDGSTISAEGKKAVAEVVESSKKFENTEFEVYGYTDRIGSDAYNQKLSQKRADAVTSELVADGVNTVKASEGRGKSSPVTGTKCDSVKGRAALIDCLSPDRRVEIVVTGDTTTEHVEEQ